MFIYKTITTILASSIAKLVIALISSSTSMVPFESIFMFVPILLCFIENKISCIDYMFVCFLLL
ncbi:hypothetical protein C2G38_2118537 [Gigaspora rosea]|uniref:Uncharacterized protein n=1 Tax=Gigaspora rosea TaxID=44941 RepID=A0A397U8G6_9GLOM|nr:hypothetical protein C2G38_2118537 [Gigaspora rosea]